MIHQNISLVGQFDREIGSSKALLRAEIWRTDVNWTKPKDGRVGQHEAGELDRASHRGHSLCPLEVEEFERGAAMNLSLTC